MNGIDMIMIKIINISADSKYADVRSGIKRQAKRIMTGQRKFMNLTVILVVANIVLLSFAS